MSIYCSINVNASKILYPLNKNKITTDETKSCTYHTVPDKCGTNRWGDENYYLKGTINEENIKTKILK